MSQAGNGLSLDSCSSLTPHRFFEPDTEAVSIPENSSPKELRFGRNADFKFDSCLYCPQSPRKCQTHTRYARNGEGMHRPTSRRWVSLSSLCIL